MLELYHNNMSVCAQKVRLTLAEKGLTATEYHLNLRAADQQRPDYLALNPKAYVPTLVHDGDVVTESTVICEYIDDAFPDPPLVPADPLGRAYMRRWTRRPDERIHDACATVSNAIAFRHQWLARPAEELARTIANTPDHDSRERRRDLIENGVDAPRFRAAVLAYDALLADMEAALSDHKWLAGDDYSLADIDLTPYVNRLAVLGLDGLWDARPHVADWLGRITARPAFATAITAYDQPDYLELMARTGREHAPRVMEIAAAA